jgi:hypothetical protein
MDTLTKARRALDSAYDLFEKTPGLKEQIDAQSNLAIAAALIALVDRLDAMSVTTGKYTTALRICDAHEE